jgi:hypothetical protein
VAEHALGRATPVYVALALREDQAEHLLAAGRAVRDSMPSGEAVPEPLDRAMAELAQAISKARLGINA